MDEDTRVFGEASQLVGFQFVLLPFTVMGHLLALCEAPRFLDEPFLAQKTRTFERAVFIGGSEDHSVPQV
jgi:hypothetical protein